MKEYGAVAPLASDRPSIPMEETMDNRRETILEIDALLHPARAFSHPLDVVRDSDLTLYEKRAILSSWASDACAVEDVPELRHPFPAATVKFDDIMDALRALDSELQRRVGPTSGYGLRSGSQDCCCRSASTSSADLS